MNLIDITDMTDADLDNLLGLTDDTEATAALLVAAGFPAEVEWKSKAMNMGKVVVGTIEIAVERGRAFITNDSALRHCHRQGGYRGVIMNPYLSRIDAVLAAA